MKLINSKQTKLNVKHNIHINVIDVKKAGLIANIQPFDFKGTSPIRN